VGRVQCGKRVEVKRGLGLLGRAWEPLEMRKTHLGVALPVWRYASKGPTGHARKGVNSAVNGLRRDVIFENLEKNSPRVGI